jgi:sister-chromatid-cohesion protein PDS5
MDPEEKIRVAAIKQVGNLSKSSFAQVEKDTLNSIAERCKDKKLAPRNEAIMTLCKMFNCVFTQLDSVADPSLAEKFFWIPSSILELLYVGEHSIT